MDTCQLSSKVINICQSACEYYVKSHQYDKASTIYQAMLNADWLGENEKRHVSTNQKRMEASRLCYIAETCRAKGDLLQATRLFLQSSSLAENVGDLFCLQRVYSNLGMMLVGVGKHKEAINCFLDHLKVASELGDKCSMINAYGNISNASLVVGDFPTAIKYANEGLQLSQNLGYRESQLNGHFVLAQAFDASGKIDESISHFEKALELAQSLKDKVKEGDAYGGLGNAYYSMADLDNSFKYQKKFLDIALEVNQPGMITCAYSGLGLVYEKRGDNSTATQFHKKALEISSRFGDKRSQCTAFGNLGSVAFSLSNYDEAMAHFRKCLEFSLELDDKSTEGMTYGSIGKIFFVRGDYKQALEYHNKELRIAREIESRSQEREALQGKGNVLYALQEFEEAIEVYTEQRIVSVETYDKNSEANAHGNIGNCYNGLGKYMLAMVYLKEQLRLSREVGYKTGEARAHGNLGNAYYWLNRPEEALSHHFQHLRIAREINDKLSEGRCYGNLANTYRRLGDTEKAFENYALQAEFAKSICDPKGEANSCYNMGSMHEHLENYSKAEAEIRGCIEIHKAIRLLMRNEDALKVSIGEEHVRAYKKLAAILLKLKRPYDAFLSTDRGRALALKDLLRRRLNVMDEDGETEEDTETNVRTCLHSLKQDLKTTTLAYTVMPDALWIWVICEDGVLIKTVPNESGIKLFEKLLKMADAALNALESDKRTGACAGRDLAAQDEKEVEDFFAIAPERIPQSKNVEEFENLTVEDIESGKFGYLFAEGKEDSEAKQSLSSPEDAFKFKESDGLPLSHTQIQECNETAQNLHGLYDILIKPVEEHIKGSHLMIIPEGFFYLIPYAALLDSHERFLSDRVSIQLCTSLETLSLHNAVTQEDLGGALIIGNPFLGTLKVRGEVITPNPLPAAQREAEAVANLFDASALVLEQATKANVLKYLSKASVVHIAAHGDSRRGEIYLAPPSVTCSGDGVTSPPDIVTPNLPTIGGYKGAYPGELPSEEDFLLTCSDISQLRMRARLVVLSCCQTASGKIKSAEGVVGIARSFLGAGVASVLVTLWEIDDEATELFMLNFYRFLLQGYPCCTSVQKSMSELRANDKFEGASYWAPFYIVGQDVKLSAADVQQIKLCKFF